MIRRQNSRNAYSMTVNQSISSSQISSSVTKPPSTSGRAHRRAGTQPRENIIMAGYLFFFHKA